MKYSRQVYYRQLKEANPKASHEELTKMTNELISYLEDADANISASKNVLDGENLPDDKTN